MPRKTTSWLLEKIPPYAPVPRTEVLLWWAVIRQSAYDLRYSHRSNALDALEFLTSTGLWLAVSLYSIPEGEYKRELTVLVLARNRFHAEPIFIQEVTNA